MAYLLSVVTNFFGEHVTKKMYNIIPFVSICILIWLAAVSNLKANPDYNTYKLMYDYSYMPQYKNHFEWGYMFLTRIFFSRGVSYSDFRLVLYIIGFGILIMGISRFTKNMGSFVWVFAIFPFFFEAVQTRNFLMVSIALFGLSFLQEKNLKNILITSFFIFLSGSMHSMGYVFFLVIPLWLVNRKYLKIIIKVFISIIVILIIVNFIPGVTNLLKNIILKFASISSRAGLNDKLDNGYDVSASKALLVKTFLYLLSIMGFEYYILEIKNLSDDIRNKLKLLFIISLLGIITLPLLNISSQYGRLQRNSFIPAIIMYAIIREHKNEISRSKLIKIDIMIISILIIAIYVYYGIFNPQGLSSYIPYLAHWKNY